MTDLKPVIVEDESNDVGGQKAKTGMEVKKGIKR